MIDSDAYVAGDPRLAKRGGSYLTETDPHAKAGGLVFVIVVVICMATISSCLCVSWYLKVFKRMLVELLANL